MTDEHHKEACEGTFDVQLSFNVPFVEVPQPIRTILKRDGRQVAFDQAKIAEAIFKAAQVVGGQDRDRAESLASGVTIYLNKTLKKRPPTVDCVHDAVEKVLIEMGHAKTALSYARYRDRRARIRDMRAGKTGNLLGELEAALSDEGQEAPLALFVRTSDDALLQWDRQRIVAALVRETQIAAEAAEVIALEVERQIVAAEVQTLTASLVRELVDAKLIEHGLEECRHRHMRLGVPLYDAEHIIRGPNTNDLAVQYDPDVSNRILAERVKREYALTQVFGGEAADAHLRGDLHLHELGHIDRLHGCIASMEYLKLYGLALDDAGHLSKAPMDADSLVSQLVGFTETLGSYFTETIGWDSVNMFLAPFVTKLSASELEHLAHTLVLKFAWRAAARGRKGCKVRLGLTWNVPAHLKGVEALGPNGEYTGKNYEDYLLKAQELATAILATMTACGDPSMELPVPVIYLDKDIFEVTGWEFFLETAAELSCYQKEVDFIFHRAVPAQEGRAGWQPRDVTVHRVTINLARAAYRSKDEETLLRELERLCRLAAAAHLRKRHFIAGLLAEEDLGPLGLLTRKRDGMPWLDLNGASWLTGVVGLNECVQHLTGHEMGDGDGTIDVGRLIMVHLNYVCRQISDETGLRCLLAQTDDAELCQRFAALDLDLHPDAARAVVKSDADADRVFYTPGAQSGVSRGAGPIETVFNDAVALQYFDADAESRVDTPDPDTPKKALADFIQRAFDETESRGVRFVRT